MDRGELVALVDAAPGNLGTLTATLRHWVHHERSARARERMDDRRGVATVRSVLIGINTHAGAPSATSEHLSRVWFASPNRWCIEGEGEHRSLDISDGVQRWQGFEGLVTEGRPGPHRAADLATTGQLGRLLVPGPLLGLFTFGDVEMAERAGRRCVRAAGSRREADASPLLHMAAIHFGVAAPEHRFWFDAAHGFVLCHEALVDGEPAAVTELVHPVVDEAIAPDRFRVPSGTTIQTEAEAQLRQLERLGVDTTGLDAEDPTAMREAMAAAAGRPRLGRSATLDERARHHVPWGPPPEDEAGARAAVTAAFEAFGDTSPDGEDLVNVQAGHGLGPHLRRARRAVPGATADTTRTTVGAVRFLGPVEAAVWFSITVGGRPLPTVTERQGRAVRVDGRWLVEHATLVDLLALGGVRVPPPDERAR